MADDLRDSPFLGDRTINFVASIVNSMTSNATSKLSPVTGFEKKLLENQATVQEIDEELNNELVKLLKDAKDFIPPHTAMRVLLFGKARGLLDKTFEIVYFASRDRVVLTDEEINGIVSELRKDNDAQIQWLITLYAGDKAKEILPTDKSFQLPTNFQ